MLLRRVMALKRYKAQICNNQAVNAVCGSQDTQSIKRIVILSNQFYFTLDCMYVTNKSIMSMLACCTTYRFEIKEYISNYLRYSLGSYTALFLFFLIDRLSSA